MDDNTGHGHVWPRPDGMKARCGGPGICSVCAKDKARYEAAKNVDPAFAAKLHEITEAGYANGFLAAVVRISEEAILRPNQSILDLLKRLQVECYALPGYKAKP